MSFPFPGPRRAHWRTVVASFATLLTVGALTSCQSSAEDPSRGVDAAAERPSEPDEARSSAPEPFRLMVEGARRRSVPVDASLVLSLEGGSLRSLDVTSPAGPLAGAVEEDGARWEPSGRLEPGTRYTVKGVAERSDGSTQRVRTSFRTVDLSLDQQTYPSIAPLEGETVGVGMPVIVSFDVAVERKAAFERHMQVVSRPAQPGSWHWLSDHEVHWRPKDYWEPGTRVRVEVDVNSLPAGDGVFGQVSRVVDFEVGDSVVSRLDVKAHVMKVFVNGGLARRVPVSAGKPGWETRSGTKVIIEKFRRKRMDAATIGVSEDDPEYYNLANVEYALRVTYSGEFLHAAPWSLGAQGSANVSHGCVGMSTADAAWLYGITKRGDVVEVTGSPRQMTLTNGYGDWNASWADYRSGSALS